MMDLKNIIFLSDSIIGLKITRGGDKNGEEAFNLKTIFSFFGEKIQCHIKCYGIIESIKLNKDLSQITNISLDKIQEIAKKNWIKLHKDGEIEIDYDLCSNLNENIENVLVGLLIMFRQLEDLIEKEKRMTTKEIEQKIIRDMNEKGSAKEMFIFNTSNISARFDTSFSMSDIEEGQVYCKVTRSEIIIHDVKLRVPDEEIQRLLEIKKIFLWEVNKADLEDDLNNTTQRMKEILKYCEKQSRR